MKRMRKVFRSEEGFTLIELLIVIAVLGILAGIAVPRITGVRQDAADSAAQATASSIRNAIEMYYAKYGVYPIANDDDSLTTIQDALSTDPKGTSSSIQLSISDDGTYEVETSVTTQGEDYSIKIHHTNGSKYYTITPENMQITTS